MPLRKALPYVVTSLLVAITICTSVARADNSKTPPKTGGTVWGSFGALSGKDSPIQPPVAATPKKKIRTTRADKLRLWDMGMWITMAAIQNPTTSVSIAEVNQMYGWGAEIARDFKLPLAPLPARTNDIKRDVANTFNYCTKGLYPLYDTLLSDYSETEEVIVELSVKTRLLDLVYDPGSVEGKYISDNFKKTGAFAFPERLWKPLVDAIDRNASLEEVRKEAKKFDAAVRDWYDTSKPAPRN